MWQNALFNSGAIQKQEEYWLNRFSGEIPVLQLPADFPRPPVQCFEGDLITHQLDQADLSGLRKLAAETGTTLYMVLLAALNVLLWKYSGREEIIIGSPVAGRRHADLEQVIGMFVNLLAMRNHPQADLEFHRFLEEVKTNALQAFENQDYQFEMLVEKVAVKRDRSRNPLFDVGFSVELAHEAPLAGELNELVILPYDFKIKTIHYDLYLSVIDKGDWAAVHLLYMTKLFKQSTAERMVKHYLEIVRRIVENSRIKLNDIGITYDLANPVQADQGDFDF